MLNPSPSSRNIPTLKSRTNMTTVPEKKIAAIDDPRWARVVARDRSADGVFWYSVATTGVYCRPSCASRTANPRNVQFHDTIAAAEAAGFRACKRCKPNQPSSDVQNAQTVARICRLIEQAEVSPP